MAFLYDAISVADIAALRALDSESSPKRVDGLFVSVADAGSGQPSLYRYSATSTASDSLPLIVEPTDGIGAWYVYTDGVTSASNSFTTIAVSGQSNVVADSSSDTLTLAAGSNITITTNASTDTVTIAASGGGSSNSFANIAVSGQSTVVADDPADTLTLVGSNITITTNAGTDTITFAPGTNVALRNVEQEFTNTQRLGIVNNSFSSSITADLSLGNIQDFTLTGNLTLNATNLRNRAFYNFTFIQGGSGSYTVTFGSAFKFPNDTPPTLSTAVGSVTEISCISNGTVLRCSPGLNYSS